MGNIAPLEEILLAARRQNTGGSQEAGETSREARDEARRAALALARLGARVVARGEDAYPAALEELPDPPGFLFLRGRPLPEPAVSVALVGARAATSYGTEIARSLAADLVRVGVAVTSGLARGIDEAAHRGALEAGGTTVAVVASGLESVGSPDRVDLAEAIAASGTVVSEHPWGAAGHRGAFVERNRLIAALSAATVVVEAAEKSGALHTASAARRLGRPVLAVPGDLGRAGSRGTHALIKRGARLCEGVADILASLGRIGDRRGRGEPVPAVASPAPESSAERRLLDAMAGGARPLELLAAAAGLDAATALSALLRLQWMGVVIAQPGQRWSRRDPAR